MESTSALPIPATSGTEGGVPISDESPPSTSLRGHTTGTLSPHRSSDDCAQGDTDKATSEHPRREDDVVMLARLVAGVLKDSVAEVRKDEGARMSQLTTTIQEEFSAFREGEETRTARLEWAIKNWNPNDTSGTDQTTNFWIAYKKVADEHDDDMTSGYLRDLDTTLLFAGLFSAVTSAFIIQIIPGLQPNPTDLTNVLLLRILQQNTSFGGIDPLTPISSISTGVVKAQSLLFVCLSVTLLVAFIAVLGKQWIMYYTRPKTRNIVDRGKERHAKFVGLQKWGLRLVIDSLSVMLQFALLLFGVALTIYLWELDSPSAKVALAVTSIGFAFYTFFTLLATIFRDCPFQTPLSFLLPKVLPWMKKFVALARVWLKRKVISLSIPIIRVLRIFTSKNPPDQAEEGAPDNDYPMILSNPAFWRDEPFFAFAIPKDIAASAGFWLLENSTDSSAVSAVAAAFSQLQWLSDDRSTTTALVRLRDTYAECLRAPGFKESARLQALESAAAYYVLYCDRLIWSNSNGFKVDVRQLPPDLLLHLHDGQWGGDDVFEYLLRIEDRSEPVTSARFLSYIAPYWFCGHSDSTVRFRPGRLEAMDRLIEVLEEHQVLGPATLADCVLSVGAAMDLPLHPEDLIRVDKSDYIGPTFKLVVEHIHSLILSRGHRCHYAKRALDILHTLVRKATFPLVDPTSMRALLERAASGNMDDGMFTSFLRLSARMEEYDTWEGEPGPLFSGEITLPDTTTPEHTLFIKIMQNVQACSRQEDGWQDDAVYGGLIAMGYIPRLGSCLPNRGALGTLSKAMESGRPFRVRKSAYDVVLAVRDGWLRWPELRQAIEDLDLPRQLYIVAIETGRSDYQRSSLIMTETLSEDVNWHSYLRGAMDIWLSFRREAPDLFIRILARVGELPLSEYGGSHLDEWLERLVEKEWAAVPGRPLVDLTANRLRPLIEITTQLNEVLFTEGGRRAALAVVEQVIPGLEKRREDGYEGPEEDMCNMVETLTVILRPVWSD